MEKYTLIVTEKPDSAKRVAIALDKLGKPEKREEKDVPYFIAKRDRRLVVVPSVGHLYTITQESGKKDCYPVFNYQWVPRHLVERDKKFLSKWVEAFSNLSQNADEFVSACDYDTEGSLIGYCILKYACDNKEILAKRMKFSTLMKSELEKAYEHLQEQLDFDFIESGKTRHEVDWLYGINFSRALSLAAQRESGNYSTLSTGRVQGPTLQTLTEREKTISSFVPTPYWTIKAEIQIGNTVVEAEFEKTQIQTKTEAEKIQQECQNKAGEVSNVDLRTVHQKPPVPFDVGALQREAYTNFGYSPQRTLAVAQRLYLDALISYPRTSSQKLPPVIDYRKILCSLKTYRGYKGLASKLLQKESLKPHQGPKDDPAHPAIYATGKLPETSLGTAERRIWDLIVRRFMAVFGEDAIKESAKVGLDINNHDFVLRGRRIVKEGWIEYYKPYVGTTERLLPPIKNGDKILVRRVNVEDKFTCPPPRFNPCSLLKKMEQLQIGTKATRANIIQTLYNRKYVKDERITVTELGFNVAMVLGKYAPLVSSVELTREIEEKMEQIQQGTINKEAVINEVIKQLKPQLVKFKENEEAIGKILSQVSKKAQLQQDVIGKCPICGTGDLLIIRSRKTKKRFIGCTNYFNGVCETSFPLPQHGTIKSTKTKCKGCAWPQVLVWTRGKKPWSLCFNLNCSLKTNKRNKP
ncbi:MAG: DNA topoisomerase I [Candidatus Bathyarchaeota archaeon]|nr:DNA topoisomerase I [Candidatus Bathyarchaeota archaeon]